MRRPLSNSQRDPQVPRGGELRVLVRPPMEPLSAGAARFTQRVHTLRDRFVSETTFTPERLNGLTVLDVGCGAGRFLDIAGSSGAAVVGVDITTAVDAARENLTDRANVHLVQASVYELPFKADSFDLCYFIGVIQHTPDPERTVGSLPRVLTEGGTLALTAYERRRWTKLNGKYLARRLLRRVRREALMKALVCTMPVLFPLTEILFGSRSSDGSPHSRFRGELRPCAAAVAAAAVPVGDNGHLDMLAPVYDMPQRYEDIIRVLRAAGMADTGDFPPVVSVSSRARKAASGLTPDPTATPPGSLRCGCCTSATSRSTIRSRTPRWLPILPDWPRLGIPSTCSRSSQG